MIYSLLIGTIGLPYKNIMPPYRKMFSVSYIRGNMRYIDWSLVYSLSRFTCTMGGHVHSLPANIRMNTFEFFSSTRFLRCLDSVAL